MPQPARTHTPMDTKAPPLLPRLARERGGFQRWTATTRQPTKTEPYCRRRKHNNSLDARLWHAERQTMPFQENVSELCTVWRYRPQRWCFTLFLFFFVTFFHCRFCSFLLLLFFCSHGTAENKYLKVPQISDDIVVEFKMQLTLRYGFMCVRVWLWPQSSATTNPA